MSNISIHNVSKRANLRKGMHVQQPNKPYENFNKLDSFKNITKGDDDLSCETIVCDRHDLISEQISTLVLNLDKDKSFSESRHTQKLLRRALSIYFKLLSISPLESNYEPLIVRKSSRSIQTNKSSGKFSLNNTRLKVLNYIENLEGYSDSINSLRLLLKSSNMIYVIKAYEAIVANLYNR